MKLLLATVAFALVEKLAVGRIFLDGSECTDVACATGYSGTAGASCSPSTTSTPADFVLSGCHPLCLLPTDTTGYIISQCSTTNGAITANQCVLSCATGYRQTGNGPEATCGSAFGVFSLSGCEPVPSCSMPSSTTGYVTSSCPATATTLQTETACSVSCDTAAGYAGSPTDVCASQGAPFQFSGCEPACNLPSPVPSGYITTSCSGKQNSASCTVSCDTGNHYTGTAQDACTTPNGDHQLSGCSLLPKCDVPADIAALGYQASSCTGNIFASQCTGLTCASGYELDGNTLAAVCSTNGGTMSFTGCRVIPVCTAATTTGYDLSSCNTGSGAITAAACTPSCDTANNYGGTAVDTCASNNGAFQFTGCLPRCSLPSPITTGYTVSGCSGTTLASACTVGCASGYTGSPMASCPAAGGTMTLSGCTLITDPKCTLPGTTPGYDTTNCNTGRGTTYGIIQNDCSLSCADGYTGSAQAACSTDGGTFALSGCSRAPTCKLPADTTGYTTTRCDTAPCGSNPIDTASCKAQCAAGYTGTATDSCATDGGDFTFGGCVPMCVRPTTNVGYDVSQCDTSNAAIPASQCTVSCNGGTVSTGNGPTATCDTGFGVFTFSGCGAAPTVPKCKLPASTTGYDTSSCAATSTNMLTAAQCTVSCDTTNNYGPSGTATDTCATDGGDFVLSGCSPMCTLPQTTTGYTTTGCTGTKTSTQCTLGCDTTNNYQGTPQDSCTTAGGTHQISGCTEIPQCNTPASLPAGYDATNCATSTLMRASQCTGLSCASGYTTDGNTLQATCSSQGATMGFTGCMVIPKCSATTTTGYDLSNCNTGGGNIAASACTPTCQANYGGQAVDTCASDGAAFSFSGCHPQCNVPTTPTGYTVSGCSGLSVASACTVGCASGYTGTAEATCPAAGGTMSFSGCMAIPQCTLPATTPGYTTTSCNPGRGTTYGITAAQCIVSCAAGYTGSASVTCDTQGGEFALSGCSRMNTCTMPSSFTGYEAPQCQTNSVCGSTDPSGSADYAMRGEHPAALLLLVVGIMQWLKL